MVWLPLTGKTMSLINTEHQLNQEGSKAPMPVLFVGHGSPMNALEENTFSSGWQTIGKSIPVPRAVLCISAHWETKGTFVTAMERPRTIHDFYGFPEELFAVEYPAPGSPELAGETIKLSPKNAFRSDLGWGLDHGCWSILKHLYPNADVPVVQLSLDYSLKPSEHYELAGQLRNLRRRGILIMGSGNIVHNLRMLNWKDPGHAFPWAEEASELVRQKILKGDHRSLAEYQTLGRAMELSVPTPEHYLPMLYTLALQEKEEQVTFFNDQRVMGSISMTSFKIN